MNILKDRFIQLFQHNNMTVNLLLELMYIYSANKYPPQSTTYLRPTLQTRIEHSPLTAHTPIENTDT